MSENKKITDGNYDKSLAVKCINYDKSLAVRCVNGTFVDRREGNIISYMRPYRLQYIRLGFADIVLPYRRRLDRVDDNI